MKKTALLIMVITLASKFLGFGREIVLSYYFGASEITDIYLISMTIPAVIIGLVAGGIATAYIPMQTGIMSNYGVERGNQFTNNFVNIILLLTTIVLLVAMVLTQPIVKLFAIGFAGETLDQAVLFTRILLPTMYFTMLTSIYAGYLQIRNSYAVPALIGFPMNVITIITIYVAFRTNYLLLAIGTSVALASKFLFMIPFIIKEKYRHRPIINLSDENIKKTLFIALPVIVGTSISSVNIIVDKTIASTLLVGGISALSYAQKLIDFVAGLFIASIITVLYPTISKLVSENKKDEMLVHIRESINLIIIMILPITVGSIVFNREIVWMIYGRGAFDTSAINYTAAALWAYSLGMLGMGLRDVVSRGFYAMQDTKTPMINASIGVLLNIILNLILSYYLGLVGLALATSISISITALLLLISFRRKTGPLGMMKVLDVTVRVGIASAIMALIAKASYSYLLVKMASNALALIIAIAVGALVYFIGIYALKVEDVRILVMTLQNKMRGMRDAKNL